MTISIGKKSTTLVQHSNLYCKYYVTRNGNSPKIFHVTCEEHPMWNSFKCKSLVELKNAKRYSNFTFTYVVFREKKMIVFLLFVVFTETDCSRGKRFEFSQSHCNLVIRYALSGFIPIQRWTRTSFWIFFKIHLTSRVRVVSVVHSSMRRLLSDVVSIKQNW